MCKVSTFLFWKTDLLHLNDTRYDCFRGLSVKRRTLGLMQMRNKRAMHNWMQLVVDETLECCGLSAGGKELRGQRGT